MSYTPNPIDTSRVTLPPELAALLEQLSENTHDIWAAQRVKDGWTLGERRDDAARKHPCLVPYAQLPEVEKKYDRIAVLGVLKAVLALGYAIHPPNA